mmetsp:Transcript_19425/g.36586  ORF Transcript_19425/g.36586 Transcript_19425/m.36586 type:complete len:106 (-) Transcript_19425:81-398(-)
MHLCIFLVVNIYLFVGGLLHRGIHSRYKEKLDQLTEEDDYLAHLAALLAAITAIPATILAVNFYEGMKARTVEPQTQLASEEPEKSPEQQRQQQQQTSDANNKAK